MFNRDILRQIPEHLIGDLDTWESSRPKYTEPAAVSGRLKGEAGIHSPEATFGMCGRCCTGAENFGKVDRYFPNFDLIIDSRIRSAYRRFHAAFLRKPTLQRRSILNTFRIHRLFYLQHQIFNAVSVSSARSHATVYVIDCQIIKSRKASPRFSEPFNSTANAHDTRTDPIKTPRPGDWKNELPRCRARGVSEIAARVTSQT